MAINFTNASGAPVTLDLQLRGSSIVSNVAVGPGETLVASLPSTIFADNNLYFQVAVLSGDAASVTTQIIYMLISQ